MIPLGGLGSPMGGPLPREMEPRFRQIRFSVQLMMASLVLFLFCVILRMGIIEGTLSFLLSQISPIICVLVGIYLFQDDEQMTKLHSCLESTIFKPCSGQCGGGLRCLMAYIVSSALAALFSLGNVFALVDRLKYLFSPSSQVSTSSRFIGITLVLAIFLLFLAEVLAVLFGCFAYQELRDYGTTSQPGDGYAEERPTHQVSGLPNNFTPFSGSGTRLDHP